MPRPLDGLHASPSAPYQNQDQCSLPPASGDIPSPAGASPAGASPAPALESETCPLDPEVPVHAGLLEKYTTDLAAFRRASLASNTLNQVEPQAAEPSEAPQVIPHDPTACNESVRAAVLDCLDAVAILLHGVEGASSPGSIGDVGTGIQIGTSTMRCSDGIEAAYDACTDQLIP